MSARKLNVKLLRKIQKHILAEPKRYNQNAKIIRANPGEMVGVDFGPSAIVPACGTVACIGGWADLLSAPPSQRRQFSFVRARRALGISHEQAARLFSYVAQSFSSWPEEFTKSYRAAETPIQKARVAVRRIDHFIATRGAE